MTIGRNAQLGGVRIDTHVATLDLGKLFRQRPPGIAQSREPVPRSGPSSIASGLEDGELPAASDQGNNEDEEELDLTSSQVTGVRKLQEALPNRAILR